MGRTRKNPAHGSVQHNDSRKTLLIEPFAGIAGDMFLAALLGLGADTPEFWRMLRSLPVDEKWDASFRHVERCGIKAGLFSVEVSCGRRGHGHGRSLPEIMSVIGGAKRIPEKVRRRACGVFRRLAAAEAEVHGGTSGRVHFHEIGAVDAIVDIAGACIALDILGVGRITAEPPPLGRGVVRTAHGILPVPAPATAALMKGFPSAESLADGELTTPTGAALLTVLADSWGSAPAGVRQGCAYGAGARDLEGMPNVLRATLFSAQESGDRQEPVAVLECNMDDFPGEHFTWLGPELLARGALDFAILPATMKKGRPGFVLQVICRPGAAEDLCRLILEETSTFGVRFRIEKRIALGREIRPVDTPYGKVSAKFAVSPRGRTIKAKPESSEVAALAGKGGSGGYYRKYRRVAAALEEEVPE